MHPPQNKAEVRNAEVHSIDTCTEMHIHARTDTHVHSNTTQGLIVNEKQRDSNTNVLFFFFLM